MVPNQRSGCAKPYTAISGGSPLFRRGVKEEDCGGKSRHIPEGCQLPETKSRVGEDKLKLQRVPSLDAEEVTLPKQVHVNISQVNWLKVKTSISNIINAHVTSDFTNVNTLISIIQKDILASFTPSSSKPHPNRTRGAVWWTKELQIKSKTRALRRLYQKEQDATLERSKWLHSKISGRIQKPHQYQNCQIQIFYRLSNHLQLLWQKLQDTYSQKEESHHPKRCQERTI
ncbi:hypothetical protein CEXT_702821 [Caerostris extrusa]|uniref:Uncharacterized protein n=1 Tax=Caerostris extrusa TaxID=172846 RepID=A0AAV4N5Y8_CAEEX|nr:hypothetical protein CEXT_702821 [Caerostris extrusa]